VVNGSRREHLSVSDYGTGAKVLVVESTEAEVQILTNLDGHNVTAVLRERRTDTKVRLAPDIAHAYLFDVSSGIRICP
jgi:hypothetical protein